MLHTNYLSANTISKQPSQLTYHNIANVCSLCSTTRVALDEGNNKIYHWASNMVVEETISNISVNMQKETYFDELVSLDIYPIVYQVSATERDNMKNVLELEDKYFLNGVLLNYKTKKALGSKSVRNMGVDEKQDLIGVDYSIFLDQTHDGDAYSLQDLILQMVITALNQHRRIHYIPHETLPINIFIQSSVLDGLDARAEEVGLKSLVKSDIRLTEYLLNKLDDSCNDEVSPMFSKIYKDLVTVSFLKDKTSKDISKNYPIPFVELFNCYKNSFDVNRYSVL